MSDIEDQGSFRASRSIPSEREDGAAPMLEKMARDMGRRSWAYGAKDFDERWRLNPSCREEWTDIARAALEAIREPSVEVAEAGMIAGGFTGYADVAFTAMIDAILQGKA